LTKRGMVARKEELKPIVHSKTQLNNLKPAKTHYKIPVQNKTTCLK